MENVDFCTLPWKVLRIDHISKINSCCFIPSNSIGQISYTDYDSLMKIWNSEQYSNFRKIMMSNMYNCCSWHKDKNISKNFCVPDFNVINDYSNNRLITLNKYQEENLNKYKNNIINRKTILDNYPLILDINLGHDCNFRCPMCFMIDDIIKRKNLKLFNLEKFKNELYDIFKYSIYTSLIGGEPTIYEEYDEIIEILKEVNSCKLFITTNGSTIITKIIPNLDILYYISISIDAASEETYSKIRINGNWNKLQKNLKLLNNEIGSKNITIRSNYVIKNNNYYEMENMVINSYENNIRYISMVEVRGNYKNDIDNKISNLDELKKYADLAINKANNLGIQLRIILPSIKISENN